MFKKSLIAIIVLALIFNVAIPNKKIKGNDTVHIIEKGTSRWDNPLKGFVPFDYEDPSFPHTMEWFYIPVSDVQKSMDSYDWSKLENRLNAIANRGHQAVFRFYYDYPGEGNGVPQFVKDAGLQMEYYNEPDDLGGDGYCPDYSNAYFRQSMTKFIEKFGEKYDGDGRIAYVTVGLLGFWGEWHNWPYDEDTSDRKPDWSIPSYVYSEVLTAFDNAFNTTKLCVREPKGNNYASYDVGYHDDSFAYATLSMANGGQDWSFMQKMKNYKTDNVWKNNPIGGEIYPPIQAGLFSTNPSADCQNWDKCLEETHASWLLFDQMRNIKNATVKRAETAQKQLGYDLQVDTATFSDDISAKTTLLSVNIKNIGIAPFYYGHDLWPVDIALKNGDKVVETYRTTWDLCDVQPNKNKDYSYSLNLDNVANGNYDLCMRVVNPVSTGKSVSFANKNQDENGWLKLGSVNVNIEDPTTARQTTAQVTTARQTTAQVTTARQTTAQITTARQTTAQITTARQTTAQVTTARQTTAQITTARQTTAQVTTARQTTAQITTARQTTAQVTTTQPATEIKTSAQATTVQTTSEQTTAQQTTSALATRAKVTTKSVADNILSASNDKDFENSTFHKLKLGAKKVKKKSIKLSWKKIKGAKKYLVFGGRCGEKYKLLKVVYNNSFKALKLKKAKYYKYLVVAMNDSNTLAVSKIVHAITAGGKYGNVKKIKPKKTKVKIKVNKKYKIKFKVLKNKKLKEHRKISFESDNKDVANVNKNGVIKGIKRGKCKIYIYASNGKYAVLSVTIK